MPLTDADTDLVRRSLEIMRERRADRTPFGTAFYDRLFEHLPEARALFRPDLEAQGMRFLSTLQLIVDALDKPEALDGPLARLGEGHRAYGVRPEHFAPMAEALLETMRGDLGERFDAETEAAWRRAYDEVAERMTPPLAAG